MTALTDAPPEGTADDGLAGVVASRTPAPTRVAGPVEREVSEITNAAGVADTSLLGLTTADWINLAVSVLTVLLTLVLSGPVLKRVLQRAVKTTSTEFDDRIVKSIVPPVRWLVVLFVVEFSALRLDFISIGLRRFLQDVFFVLYATVVGIIIWKLLDLAIEHYTEQVTPTEDADKIETLLPLARRIAQVAIILICFSVVLEHFGIPITAAATSLGIAGLAFSLAAHDTLADAISGFVIMLDRPFRVGDRIEIQGLSTWGDVVEIGTRTTRIRTRDNRLVIVPNSIISKNQVVNYSYPDPLYRVQIEIGIGYGADIEAVRRIIRDAVRKVEGVLPDKPVDALFLEFGEPVMIFRVRWWIDSYIDTRRMFDSVNEALYEALAAAGIDMPFTDDDVSIKFNDQDLDRLTKMA
jgi:small-conductance mechanosensitive channel